MRRACPSPVGAILEGFLEERASDKADLLLLNPTLGCTCLATGWAQAGGVCPGVSQVLEVGGHGTEEVLPG